jgi:hypothetical protein
MAANQFVAPQTNPLSMAPTPGPQSLQGPGMSGSDYYGMPFSPGMNPIYTPGMNLTPEVSQALGNIDLSGMNGAVGAFQGLAEQQGPSAWATLAGEQQNQLMQEALDQQRSGSMAGESQAMNQLEQTGGLSSGARERAVEAGQRGLASSTQGIEQQNENNQLQIGVNDAQQRMQELGMLPGIEAQGLAPQFQEESIWQNAAQNNVNNTMMENSAVNSWNQNLYNQQMQAWAANQQANATANSGKK